MDSLLTPAPSSDPAMPGSSPVKRQNHDQQRKTSGIPLSSLDLNIAAERAKAFQADRQKAGQTPPPSSPLAALRHANVTTASSPSSSPPLVPGASPSKSQRVARRSDASEARLVRGPLFASSSSQLDDEAALGAEEALPLDVGIEQNSDAQTVDDVPHLLWACQTHSLIIGRCKPSGLPHTSYRTEAEGVASSQDVALLQSIAPSTQGLGARKLVRVNLPNEARHVSRVHAIIEWIPFVNGGSSQSAAASPSGTYILRIVGQNGLIVDGKRRREGQVLRLTPGKSTLDFFGVKCRFEARTPQSATAADKPTSAVFAQKTPATNGQSPVKRLSYAQVKGSRSADISTSIAGLARSDLPSSPPPTSELHFPSSSPSKSSIGHGSSTKNKTQQHAATTSRQRIATSEGLKAGANAQRSVMIGASDDEEQEDDDEDDEEDEDYLPEVRPAASRKASEARSVQSEEAMPAIDEAIPTPSASRAASPAPLASSQARSAASSSSGKRTKKGSQVPSKPAQAGKLTESQTRMPPPAVVRAVSRRSASNSPAPGSPLVGGSASIPELQSLARRCVRQLAPTYDLEGLLAGAIVFHRTATISASEAVRSVLASTPGLMKGEAGEHSVAFSPSRRKLPGAASAPLKHGCVVDGWPVAAEGGEKWASIARKAWREHLEVVLQSSPMFGVITRAGKDASGNPLECWYYYEKANDPDKERAENLGAFAKPMRKAIKGQKPIFWKKSGYGSRKDDFETKPPVATAAAAAAAGAAAAAASTGMEESINIATSSLPRSALAEVGGSSQRTSRKRQLRDMSDDDDDDDDEEAKQELLRAKIARSGVWDETQPEEKEDATWDRYGDLDWSKPSRGK